MSRGVYLRADGRLPCYCGSGETVTLGQVPIDGSPFQFISDYYRKGLFSHIRKSMSSGIVPFPGICDQCTYLDLDHRFEQELIDTELDWFHWEPSSLCMLDCQWCTVERFNYYKKGQNRLLPLEVFERIVTDMSQNGLRLNMGNICGVGEPTLNPDIWQMIRIVREKLGGDILISTNGNGPYSEAIVTSGLDKIKIAVDAVKQETYVRYRKNGSLQKAIAFTKAIANEKARLNKEKPSIIWQYILFNYNDSDEDLITYQKMAEENGVNQLRIVYTRCNNYSIRTPDDFPKVFPDIIFFPIGTESQLSPPELKQSWFDIEAATSNGKLEQAAIETIRLINRLYHRLALGVETYNDLLAFSKGVHHVCGTNRLDLTVERFREYTEYIRKSFIRLEELYSNMGRKEQARSYRNYLKNIYLEGQEAHPK
ncbi:MAG: radical SAM protein [Syntrophales bacterium]|jgi:organic radical activating enzyme